jgi:hypothetical protein
MYTGTPLYKVQNSILIIATNFKKEEEKNYKINKNIGQNNGNLVI